MFIDDDYSIAKLDNIHKMTNEELDYNIDLFIELSKYFKEKCFSGKVKSDSLLQVYTTISVYNILLSYIISII